MLIVYCKRSDEEENNHFVHYLFAINDGLCQVRDPGKDASLDEHYDQVFHLARKYCIIPGCTKQLELLSTDTGYLPQEYMHLKKLVYRNVSILAPKHGAIADHYGH